MDGSSMPHTFLFIEIRRSSTPRVARLNALDKGKSFSRTRRKAVFEDIDFLLYRPESCVDLRAQGDLLKAVLSAHGLLQA
jgi:hypothetical protein